MRGFFRRVGKGLGLFCLLAIALPGHAQPTGAGIAAPGTALAPPEAIEEIPDLPAAAPIDLTLPAPDIWSRIRRGFSMPNLNDELVLRYQQQYQAHPEFLRRMVERSRPYLFHIVEALERRHMPMELALLPMVESAYNPMAESPARAMGLWQFIPSTGKNFDLDQNWWRDERRDVVASTSAALDYLQAIYSMHGDWHLALASYNWGEGAVGRAIAKNENKGLPADYANLKMPNETRNYVPKLQALKNIFSQPALMKQLGIPEIPNEPYFHSLITEAPIDRDIAAKLADLSLPEFTALNPAYQRPVISPNSRLLIPADRVHAFEAAMRETDAPLSRWQSYSVQKGEKLEDLAPRFGIALADLKRANGLHGSIEVPAGQAILVPGQDGETLDEADFAALAAGIAVQRDLPRWHRVQRGETLSGIARRYGVSVAYLKNANRLRSNAVRHGQRLKISDDDGSEGLTPPPRARRATAQTPTRHIVRAGDTLSSIARRYGIPVANLRRWNPNARTLKIGASIRLSGS
ncbi:MAG: LysM peptidoglycan-binding domain-containing protein [Zoogloeaceae bacterium]|nr:LysM peptidoglycan-binding domain-containing protein [Zoogloeaceae bacterium]